MPIDETPKAPIGAFDPLTEKQTAVLDLLARGMTSKEIAGQLGTAESSVNRHIEIMRSRFGGITRAQLAQRYRERAGDIVRTGAPDRACVDATEQKIDLAGAANDAEGGPQDSPEANLAFKDSLQFRIDAPWTRLDEPRVVPRVLDGDNAQFTRGAAIAFILLATIASLVLGLAAALAITEALGGKLP